MSKKLKLRPSSAPQFIRCPGSVALQAKLPKQSSDFADEGSAAHALSEIINRQLVTYEQVAGWWMVKVSEYKWELFSHEKAKATKQPKYQITDEMITNCKVYTDWCASIGGVKEYEKKFDGGWLYPGLSGTADFFAIVGDTLYIGDLKYGAGVRVEVEENEQLLLYTLMALGVEPDPAIKTVSISIIQPRYSGEEKVSTWEISAEQLEDWMNGVLLPAFVAVNQENAPLNPGEKQCRFCMAKKKNKCPARTDIVANTTGMSLVSPITEPRLPAPQHMTPDDMARVLAVEDVVIAWFKDLRALAEEQALQGAEIPGHKLVRKVTRRRLLEEEAVKALGDGAFKQTMKTLTELEKEFGKKKIDPLTIKPEGELTLVQLSDKRPAVNPMDALELLLEDI